MSNVPFFSNEEENSSNKGQTGEENTQYKRPEFILIDDRRGKSQYTYFGPDSSRKPDDFIKADNNNSSGKKSPISLRFVCLLGFIFCLIFGLGIFVWSIVMTVLATLSFFQNPSLNQGMRSFWKISINTGIAGLGFTLGMLSPTLGLGLIALYFSLAGELVDEDLLRKFIRRSFNRV